jgi:integrase
MAGTVKHAKLDSRTARNRLKRGRQPHWWALVPGKIHLGYQCWKGKPAGRWVLRRYIKGKYQVTTFALADDAAQADGVNVLSFEQAEAKACSMVETSTNNKIERLTVRQAMSLYIEHKRHQGRPIDDVQSRGTAHILPTLGDLVVSELTPEVLRRWLSNMAAAPAQTRPKEGKPQYKAAPVGDEEVRRRRSSANRVLTMLKAALNHAYDEGHVSSRDAWGRKLKPFREVDAARGRYLAIAEAQRLLNTCAADFRPLVRAALETGCRYGELARLEVQDFNCDAGTIAIRRSKSGKVRHVVLTPEGAAFFRQHCLGRGGHDVMFQRLDGRTWDKSQQAEPMQEACDRAKITPRITFHGLRHTWATLAVMNDVPLMVVAKNLGHRDTRMVEHHYGHLAKGYITDAIHAGAPRFVAVVEPSKTASLDAARSRKAAPRDQRR